MKSLQAVVVAGWIVLTLAHGGYASDRPHMTGQDPREEIAKGLVNDLAVYCNSRDFVRFMDGFTERHASKIREQVKDSFLADELRMEIDEVVLFAGDAEAIEFGVKYEMSVDGSVRCITSVVTARLDGSCWKIDSEKVKKSSTRDSGNATLISAPKPRKPNIQVGGVEFGAQPKPRQEGAVRNPVPPGWDPMNPDPSMIDPKLKDMIGLVPILPGVGCVNGKCGP